MRTAYVFFILSFLLISYSGIGYITDKTWKAFSVLMIKRLCFYSGVILAIIGRLLCI